MVWGGTRMVCLEIRKKANKISVWMQVEGWVMDFVVFLVLIFISLLSQSYILTLDIKATPALDLTYIWASLKNLCQCLQDTVCMKLFALENLAHGLRIKGAREDGAEFPSNLLLVYPLDLCLRLMEIAPEDAEKIFIISTQVWVPKIYCWSL